jgi:hypothetical protein
MEITGLQCNNCGLKAFGGDDQLNMWAQVLVTVNSMRLEKRIHFCPQCFTDWNNSLQTGPMRMIDPELQRLLREDENESFAKRLTTGEVTAIPDVEGEKVGSTPPKSPPLGEAAIPQPPAPVKNKGRRNG